MSAQDPSRLPILYSFRRCPYAMRGRMGLWSAGIEVRLREVVLRDKPQAMLDASPKGTVPVLLTDEGTVLDESIDIIRWALAQNDPDGWLRHGAAADEILEEMDGPFKEHLDRYKYHTRYEGADPDHHRVEAFKILERLNRRIAENGQLLGPEPTLADYASFPFIRQFANHDRKWFDALPLKSLQTWLAGHLSSDIFKSVMPKFDPWQPGNEPVIFGPASVG